MVRMIRKILYILQVIVLATCILFSCGKNTTNNVVTTETTIVESNEREFTFRTNYLKKEHFDKHKKEFNYKDADEYELGANRVIHSKDALIKEEKDENDGDYIYYIVDTNEIVFLSKDGYIRSYFKPTKGKRYFDKQ